jgi:hypothetical protein
MYFSRAVFHILLTIAEPIILRLQSWRVFWKANQGPLLISIGRVAHVLIGVSVTPMGIYDWNCHR